MNKSGITIIGTITAIMIILVFGFFLFPRQSEEGLPPGPAQENSADTNLGFTYLPITPQVSAYYELGVDSGVLITEVIPRSLADKAGVEVGDVILSFNGARLEDEVTLLGMMMSCPTDHMIEMEVWREEKVSTIEFIHGAR